MQVNNMHLYKMLMEYLQTILFSVQLQFHRFISECFAANFVLFLNERDGLTKWAPT